MFTMLAASKMNGGRDRLHELSGTPPLSFTAKGKPLTAWSITGNTVQNGTPTPDNPVEVQSVGDYDSETGLYKIPVVTREKNLFNYNLMFQNSVVYNDYFNVYNLILKPYTEYEISTNGEEKHFNNPALTSKETQFIVCNTSELFSTVNGGVSYKKKLFKTTGADGVLVVGYRTKHSPEGANIVNKADMDAGILWLNIIQTPITTPIYLPTPLYSGEVMRSDGTITRSDGTTETFTAPQIPTLNGTTVIDVDTAVKPERMTIKYRR